MGRLCKPDFMKIMNRMKDRPDGKYIEVTAITPPRSGKGQTCLLGGEFDGTQILGSSGK